MQANRARPIRLRTCIAHRTTHPDSELLRVVATTTAESTVIAVPDPQRSHPGRGAWIRPTLAAYELAEKRRAFGRALRVSAAVDTGQIRKYLEAKAAKEPHAAAGDGRGEDPEIVRKTEH
ncbi:YlxR family protein [Corynebacterium confusum]